MSPTTKRHPTCAVIGAGPGIGTALAHAFAHEGLDVALMARNVGKFVELPVEIAKHGRRLLAYTANAADTGSIRAALSQAESELGEIEVLVYNAASAGLQAPLGLGEDKLIEDFRINVLGALTAAQAVAEGMKRRGRGTILFTGGGFAYEPASRYASLSLGKAALRNLTYSLAQELGTFGIHVATVTVYGFVQSGTHFDPRRIAQTFVDLHRQPRGHFDIEKIYK